MALKTETCSRSMTLVDRLQVLFQLLPEMAESPIRSTDQVTRDCDALMLDLLTSDSRPLAYTY